MLAVNVTLESNFWPESDLPSTKADFDVTAIENYSIVTYMKSTTSFPTT